MLRNALRLLMFSLLLVAFLPLFMAGVVGFMVRLKTRNRGISGTAYEPFVNRLIFHHAGTRDDAAAVRLAPHLPALSPTVAWLLIGTMGLAARLSGYQGSFLSYPGARPSSMALAMVHRTAFSRSKGHCAPDVRRLERDDVDRGDQRHVPPGAGERRRRPSSSTSRHRAGPSKGSRSSRRRSSPLVIRSTWSRTLTP